MKQAVVNLTLILFSWMLGACGKNDTAAPYIPPVIPPVTDTTIAAQYGTPFANVTDPQDAVIYQVNMRVFSQQGNFAGVTARLNAIKDLGANVVYLMPVFPVGQLKALNSPYCVKDYFTINPEFGTLTDLRTLIETAHQQNMSVILDWVANHTAWDHSWITAHKDWYMQDGSGNIISPPGTGWNDVAQLNYQNAEMRKAMIKAMKFWVMTANIDGFRCDYADGPPTDFWKQAMDTLRGISTHKLIMLAEGGRTANFTLGFNYNFGFSYFNTLKDIYSKERPVTAIDTLNTSEYLSASPGQRVVRYTSNHDVNGSDGPPTELFGGIDGAMAAFVVTSFMKSVPMIYNGQEVATAYRLLFPFTMAKIDWSVHPEVTALYKKVLAFRSGSTAVKRGALTTYSNSDVCAFTKVQGTEQVLVIANLRNRTVNYTVPAALQPGAWKDALSGNAATLGTTITLAPYEYRILKL